MKHISIDFWNTLAKPNPRYALERNEVLASIYAKSLQATEKTYLSVKETIDQTHCATAKPLSLRMCYMLLDEAMGGTGDVQTMLRVRVALEQQFRNNMPFLNDEVVIILNAMRKNHTLSIGSNTNFIRGAILKEAVIKDHIPFSFCLFSDEVGYAKPHPQFWKVLKDRVWPITEVVHIGDNMICDFDGPNDNEIQGVHIKGPNELATALRSVRDKNNG